VQRIAAEDRRQALLAAALRVIARDGIARASTRAVAAEAGMPTASFHYVFASHDAMVARFDGQGYGAFKQAVAEAVVEAPTLRAFTEQALLGWLARAVADPEAEVALHEIVAWSRASADLGHLATAVYAQYTASVTSFVQAAEVRYGVRWRFPSGDVARFVLVITDGVAARWLVDRDEAAARRALATGAAAVLALVGA